MNWHSPHAAAGLLASALLASSLYGQSFAVVKTERVNLRGQPTTQSEVITQLRVGERVTVLERSAPGRTTQGEPSRWSKIQLPSDVPVWIYARNVDPITKQVQADSRNIRTGPGLNFSVIGMLKAGDVVREIRTLDDWMEIVAPEGAYAFVASRYLEFEAGSTVPQRTAARESLPGSQTPPVSSPPEAIVAETVVESPTPPVVARPVRVAAPAEPGASGWDGYRAPQGTSATGLTAWSASTTRPEQVARKPLESDPAPVVTSEPLPPSQPVESRTTAAAGTSTTGRPGVAEPPTPEAASVVEAPASPTVETESSEVSEYVDPAVESIPAAPRSIIPGDRRQRIVRREGIVRRTRSIQAPTPFELRGLDTRKRINYLLPLSAAVQIRSYAGQQVIVTGEEMIESRWPKTPVIEVHEIVLAP